MENAIRNGVVAALVGAVCLPLVLVAMNWFDPVGSVALNTQRRVLVFMILGGVLGLFVGLVADWRLRVPGGALAESALKGIVAGSAGLLMWSALVWLRWYPFELVWWPGLVDQLVRDSFWAAAAAAVAFGRSLSGTRQVHGLLRGSVVASLAWTDRVRANLQIAGVQATRLPWWRQRPTRLWVERIGDAFVMKRWCPLDSNYFWVAQLAAFVLTLTFAGTVFRFMRATLGDALRGDADVLWLPLFAGALVLVNFVLFRAIVWLLPWPKSMIGEWSALGSFTVGARSDFYSGWSREAKPMQGTVIVAHFKDGSQVVIAESEDAGAALQYLHTDLVHTFIDGRAAFFEQQAAESRRVRNESDARVKVV